MYVCVCECLCIFEWIHENKFQCYLYYIILICWLWLVVSFSMLFQPPKPIVILLKKSIMYVFTCVNTSYKCFWLNGESNVWQKIEHIFFHSSDFCSRLLNLFIICMHPSFAHCEYVKTYKRNGVNTYRKNWGILYLLWDLRRICMHWQPRELNYQEMFSKLFLFLLHGNDDMLSTLK